MDPSPDISTTLNGMSIIDDADSPPPPPSVQTDSYSSSPENLQITILKSETRETDELDKKPFTCYIIRVDFKSSDKQSFEIQRRYSQFHELKEVLLKCHPSTKVAANQFPPKQFLNKLNPKTVELRTVQLATWMNELLTSHPDAEPLLSFLELSPSSAISAAGAPAPVLEFTDIHGRIFKSENQTEQLIIYAAASRYNFQQLEKFIKPAMDDIVTKHPDLKCTIVSVADLRIVPPEARGMVKPVLAMVDAKNSSISNNSFRTKHPSYFNGFESYFCPDYTVEGELLKLIGCSDANWTFRVFLVAGGAVVGSMQSSTKNITGVCTSLLNEAISKNPEVVRGWPKDAKEDILVEGETDVGRSSKVSIDGAGAKQGTQLGIEFGLVGNKHNDIVFSLEVGGKLSLPKRTINCKDGYKVRVSVENDGNFTLKFKNVGKVWNKKLKYRVVASL